MPPSPLDAWIIDSSTFSSSILTNINRIQSYSGRGSNTPDEFIYGFERKSSKDYKLASDELIAQLTGNNLEFKGLSSTFKLYSPANFETGSSIAHLSLDYSDTADFLMMPFANHIIGSSLDDLINQFTRNGTLSPRIPFGPMTVDLFESIGWQIHNPKDGSIRPKEAHFIEFESMKEFNKADIESAGLARRDFCIKWCWYIILILMLITLQ